MAGRGIGPGAFLAGRFEVRDRAATGGMATVYRAHDRQSGEDVALKILAPETADLERFHREAAVLAQLEHSGVVRYVAHGATGDGNLYLAMEWLDGESLAERLARAPLTVAESVALMIRVARILAVAHEQGVVHRDIKPSNLFLVGDRLDRVKLLDFGIARLTEVPLGSGRTATMVGAMMGTPGYIAPEQTRGEEVDARADVFALGCVLFECLTGRPPFVGLHAMAVLVKILLEDAPRVSALRPDLPEALDALVARLLAKDPAGRPRDAAAVVAELETLEVGETAQARPSLPAAGLGDGEQRLLSVVLATAPPSGTEPLAALRDAVAPYGGRLDQLADGSVAWALANAPAATDLAAQAARCALSMQALLPGARLALATGRAVVSQVWSLGEVIDRAARVLGESADDGSVGILVDQVTAGLLDARFQVAGTRLLGEREIESPRTLLGKPTPCVGRQRELAQLEATWDECVSEPRAHVVLVTAPPGTGKSRLRQELVARVEQRGAFELWAGRGDPMRAGAPFGLIAPVIRGAAGIQDGEAPAVRRRKLEARVARHLPAADARRVSLHLGEAIDLAPEGEAGARAEPMVVADRMRAAWLDWLAAETAAHPVFIVLEDLHWGDLPTVKLIDAALRALREQPLFVLALARPDVHDHFPRLWAERGVQEVRLGELSRKASLELVRQVLPAAAPPLVDRLVAQAEGNAFYLEELVRAVAEGNADELPETVVAMVQARLERLEPEARRILRAASVFGQVFWRTGVLALLGGQPRTGGLRGWLDHLAEREVITRRSRSRFPDEDEYSFRAALVREAAYAMLTEADRALGHQLAAEWLHQAGETEAATLAEHHERGGKPERAAPLWRRAAEQALKGNDIEAALRLARRGIEIGASGELGALRLVETEAQMWRGEYREAEASGGQALGFLPEGSPAWHAAAAMVADAAGRVGRIERLMALAEQLRDLAPGRQPDAAHATALARVASQLILLGKVALARELHARIDGGEWDDPAATASVNDSFAVRALFSGDLGEYLTRKERTVHGFMLAAQPRSECVQRVRLGYACLELGDYPRAVTELRAALAQGERLGIPHAVALAQHNLGMALARSGEVAEGLRLEAMAVDAFVAQGDRRLEVASRLYLAAILEVAGNLGRAAKEAAQAAGSAQDRTPVRALALAQLARLELAQGAADKGLAAAKDAWEILETLGGVDEGESLIRLVLAEAQAATGDRAAAATTILAARERVLERAAKISDPTLRRMFIEKVPENARTLALATAWA